MDRGLFFTSCLSRLKGSYEGVVKLTVLVDTFSVRQGRGCVYLEKIYDHCPVSNKTVLFYKRYVFDLAPNQGVTSRTSTAYYPKCNFFTTGWLLEAHLKLG